MAIDTTLFVADIPAGTYTKGTVFNLAVKAGPAVVRDGYGKAILKEINTGALVAGGGATIPVRFTIQNQNWVDPIYNAPAYLNDVTVLNEQSSGVQKGNECELQPNSGWIVTATVTSTTVTTTAANTAYALIDIEYPSVSAVQDPTAEAGAPCSILESIAITVNATGTASSASWNVLGYDDLKAGYRYLMQKVSATTDGGKSYPGFVSIDGAASMQGLTRILPINTNINALCKRINYASVLTKGPMVLKAMFFDTSAGTDTAQIVIDYVKRS